VLMRASLLSVGAGVLHRGCRPSSPAAPPGGRYDPLDSFYLPIWGFDGLQRPGPSIAIVAGC